MPMVDLTQPELKPIGMPTGPCEGTGAMRTRGHTTSVLRDSRVVEETLVRVPYGHHVIAVDTKPPTFQRTSYSGP
jgi:hypothetical protein